MKTDQLQSVTDQHYNGHEIQIDYFDLYAFIWIDGQKITRVTAPESPLDWAHQYVDKTVRLQAAKTLQG